MSLLNSSRILLARFIWTNFSLVLGCYESLEVSSKLTPYFIFVANIIGFFAGYIIAPRLEEVVSSMRNGGRLCGFKN